MVKHTLRAAKPSSRPRDLRGWASKSNRRPPGARALSNVAKNAGKSGVGTCSTTSTPSPCQSCRQDRRRSSRTRRYTPPLPRSPRPGSGGARPRFQRGDRITSLGQDGGHRPRPRRYQGAARRDQPRLQRRQHHRAATSPAQRGLSGVPAGGSRRSRQIPAGSLPIGEFGRRRCLPTRRRDASRSATSVSASPSARLARWCRWRRHARDRRVGAPACLPDAAARRCRAPRTSASSGCASRTAVDPRTPRAP